MSEAPLQLQHVERLLNQGHRLTLERHDSRHEYIASIADHHGAGPTPGAALTMLDGYLWRKVFSPLAAKEREAAQSSGGSAGSAPSSYRGPDSASRPAPAAKPVAKDRKKS